ncbi:MAG: metal-dependent hydrolase [Myxococcales bacterium]|nr:metal-dependent hydrolase [Myxococcales bacterium]
MTASAAQPRAAEPPATRARQTIRPRRPKLDYSDLPRHWLAGNRFATQLVNGLNLLFPRGERFFVRSVNHYLPEITDLQQRADVRGFFGQEGRHAAEHERFFEVMERQGYEIREFLQWYGKWTARLESVTPPALNLAATAAAEHFTALFADVVLRQGLLDEADPRMRDLLLWHAVEEIEHKAVAYDVLQVVAPSHALRAAGLLLASTELAFFWFHATRMLLRQDPADGASVEEEREQLRASGFLRPSRLLAGMRDYLRPDFHPWQHDNSELAKAHVRAAGLDEVS